MSGYRTSHASIAAIESAPIDAQRDTRPSLVLVPESSRATPLAAAKGAAPGRYYPGSPILARGARVGILCDTLHGDREIGLDYEAGLRTAAELVAMLGFEPVIDPVHRDVAPYFERWAGTVSERAQHFIDLIERHRVDAVFPLFGKGGCHAVVDAIAASGYRPPATDRTDRRVQSTL